MTPQPELPGENLDAPDDADEAPPPVADPPSPESSRDAPDVSPDPPIPPSPTLRRSTRVRKPKQLLNL